jgi:mono/diheme cytochrome c family protein
MDLNRLTPVEQANKRRRWIRSLVIAVLVVVTLYYLLFENTYVVAYEDDQRHFMYGSIGSEIASGLPYWVFKALPVLYEEELGPKGYGRFGFLYESEDADLPIGFSRRIVQGIERVWLNCAVCHVGTYRESASSKPVTLYGAPSNNLRLYEFIQFLRQVAVDSKFAADNVVRAINSDSVGGDLNFFEEALYRYVIVDRVRDGLLDVRERLGFLDHQLDWGPGRVDTFNPYKAIQFGFPMDPDHITEIELNGSSDYPSIWHQAPREGMQLHWDGNNPSVAERNLSAALGAGVTPVTVDRDSIKRLEGWMWDLPHPPFPKATEIDVELAEKGRELYAYYCADCHGMGAGESGYDYDTARYSRLGKVTALSDIATDRGRWASYTENFAAAQNLLYAGYPWRFHQFRKTDGYANHPLDGIWARSPYLHNGSVPTLRDLLETAENRPAKWYRGSDVFDFEKVGYRSDEAAASKESLFLYDTSRPGNSNRGHDGAAYGTELDAAGKASIVEYMKTL